MLESIVAFLAAVSATAVAGLTVAVVRLNKRSQHLHNALIALQQETTARNSQLHTDPYYPNSSLSGLRIALAVNQDHTIPTLSLLLKDALSARDAEVTLIDPNECDTLVHNWGQAEGCDQPDILIWGVVTCNGYSEQYYKVMLNYLTPYGSLNPTSEQPAQGSPQSSLVITIVSKIEKDLNLAERRYERSRAIRELRQIGI
jgi:hypothetical protein